MKTKPYCTSWKCTGMLNRAAPTVGVPKDVTRGVTCPDCLSVLVWRKVNEKGNPTHYNIPRKKENR